MGHRPRQELTYQKADDEAKRGTAAGYTGKPWETTDLATFGRGFTNTLSWRRVALSAEAGRAHEQVTFGFSEY